MVILCRRSYCGVSIRLLALIGSEKKSNDLCAGAAIVRPEQAAADAGGDAVLHGPGHGVGIVAVRRDVAEGGLAVSQLPQGPVEEIGRAHV